MSCLILNQVFNQVVLNLYLRYDTEEALTADSNLEKYAIKSAFNIELALLNTTYCVEKLPPIFLTSTKS